MTYHIRAPLILCCLQATAGAAAPKPPAPVFATAETTLATASGQVRQFAFDADPATYFASERPAGAGDHFTLAFDRAVKVTSVSVTTGRPRGGDALDAGTLELSEDGKTFSPVAKFDAGAASAKLVGRAARAVRVRPSTGFKAPLVIREFVIVSDPAVVRFTYPVEFVIDVSDAPEMKEWAEKVARVCERAYPMINEELKSDGYTPPRVVRMALKSSYNGVAMAGRGGITGSVKYFKSRPEDVGAMVHEAVHVVQQYRTRGNPGWLVEGVADYVRFFRFEPGKIGRISPARARYNASYRVTGAFLAYLVEKYDRDIVRKLNQAMREGEYSEGLFKKYTGKTVQVLDKEWRDTLK
jgi:hypothetical protein